MSKDIILKMLPKKKNPLAYYLQNKHRASIYNSARQETATKLSERCATVKDVAILLNDMTSIPFDRCLELAQSFHDTYILLKK